MARGGGASSAASGSTAFLSGSDSAPCSSSGWPTSVACDRFAISTCSCSSRSPCRFWFFNEGRIFTSVPLVYPVLLYLLGRTLWIGMRDRAPTAPRPVWPVWLLVAATIFLAGFRIGLDLGDSNVIDVGYSGVIGAQRIASGQAPYGHFPQESGAAVRARRPQRPHRAAHPGERALRGAERARRHVRPGGVRGVLARLRDLRMGGEGRPAARRALHVDRLRPRLHARARARRPALRRTAACGDARVRLGCVPVHAVRRELELERRHPARAA